MMQPIEQPSKNERYPSLNGLRAISILLVIITHLGLGFFVVPILKFAPVIFFGGGGLGVNVFFVISGFLITSLLLNEEKKTGSVSLKKFYARRILRIFPAYYFMLLVFFVLQQFGIIHMANMNWFRGLTYTKGIIFFRGEPSPSLSYIDHTWSLSVEEFFYMFYPLLFLLGDKTRKSAAWLLFFLVPVIRFFTYSHPIFWITGISMLYRVDAIATGCLLALYKDRIVDFYRSHASIYRHPKIIFWGSLVVLYFVAYTPFLKGRIRMPNILFALSAAVGDTIGTVANVAVAVILLYSVFVSKGGWFKLLNSKIMNYIGVLSYSLYLWQELFVYVNFEEHKKYWWGEFPQKVVFIFAAALFSYYVIEKPFLKLKEKFKR